MAAAALTGGHRYGKARRVSEGGALRSYTNSERLQAGMIQPEWGTKRSCPKCATRFYDLQKDDPVTCINCSYAWEPEPVLKSKQPLAFEVAKPASQPSATDLEGEDQDLDIVADDEEPSADDEVDLGGDDDLGVETDTKEDEH